jgi:single-stranded-DNA-specific exonuclease
LEFLELLEPTGYGNRSALFISRNLKVLRYRTVGDGGKHLKLTVSDGGITYDAIAFQFGYWSEQMPACIDLAYSFEKNEYNGRESLQLRVKDLKAAGSPD